MLSALAARFPARTATRGRSDSIAIANEVPTLLLVLIVIMVIVRPF